MHLPHWQKLLNRAIQMLKQFSSFL
jgi:hypothetical protein